MIKIVAAYLGTRLVEGGVWALLEVDSLDAVGLLVVPKECMRVLKLTW